MGAKTKEVGGTGLGRGVGDAWNAFLLSQLGGGSAGRMPSSGPIAGGAGGSINDPAVNAGIAMGQNNAAQPGQQTNGFMQGFQNMLGGNVNDMSGAGGALQNFFQNGGANFQMPTFNNPYTSPEFQAPTLQGLPTNFGQGQTGMANLGGFGNAAQSNFNTQQDLGGISSQFTNPLMQMAGQGMQQMQGQSGFSAAQNSPSVQMQNPMAYQQAYETLGQDPLMERNRMKAVADMRARFGAEGAGGLGTGAQYAEGTLNAELGAQDASMRRNQAMQLMGQDLAAQNALANVGLQNRGQDMQTAVANMQGGLQGAQNMNSFNLGQQGNMLQGQGQNLQAMLGARGQDLSTLLGQRGQNLEQLGLGAAQSQFNTGQANSMQQAMIQAALQNQGMGNNFGLAAAGLNNDAMQNNNLNNMNLGQMMNNFNLSNAQNTGQFGLGTNQLNSSNMLGAQGLNNDLFSNMIGQGLNMNQMGNQNTLAMLSQLFGGFGQASGLNTPQAGVVASPNPWGQFGNMAAQLGAAWMQGRNR